MDVRRPVRRAFGSLWPFGQSSGGRAGRWIKAGLILLAGAGGFGECVVNFEDGGFGFVFAVVFLFVLAAHDGEGVEDVGSVLAVNAVEVEEGGGKFRAE